ncbi:MAG TPA: D-mannonate epimerase [Bacteroidales bacterium]|nr:D-mannonate epimerase [Bacteroidales bacterium]
MIYHREGSVTADLSGDDLRRGLYSALDKLGPKRKVLLIPPDHTRFHSRAGELTCMAYEYYGEGISDILPALGTHNSMGPAELDRMFPGVPHSLFRVHDWRNDVITIGEVPSSFIGEITGGVLSYPWPAQLNKLIWQGGHDLILSIGQVVPHEVIGMANYNKNLLIGCGGPESINKSHFLGAVFGMERIMGRASNPVRKVLNFAAKEFISELPVVYVHTVVAAAPSVIPAKAGISTSGSEAGDPGFRRDDRSGQKPLATRGLFIGSGEAVFTEAAELSLKVNFNLIDTPLKKVVVYLDPDEYRSTWLGNKSIYRTRMAIADGGELIVLAPGVKEFGEDREIDRLIRKYGYYGTPKTLQAVKDNPELAGNLSAAAHLIHGSSEGRFRIRYCPGFLSKKEIGSVGFEYGELATELRKYHPDNLADGINHSASGGEFFYISNPSLGLWSTHSRFDENSH